MEQEKTGQPGSQGPEEPFRGRRRGHPASAGQGGGRRPGNATGDERGSPQSAAQHTERGRKSSPGRSDDRQAAAERATRQADNLDNTLFPSMMASALGLDSQFGPHAYKVFLEGLLEDLGNPTDPIERMMVQQLALAHFRIGQLHASAGQAKGIAAEKIYNSVAARMLGEFRRTALALHAYRARVPKRNASAKRKAKVKLFKMAQ